MTESLEVDISGAAKTFKQAGINIHQAVPKLLARLSLKGEGVMKNIAPVRTGTLRRSIHAYPTTRPAGLAAGVNYAFAANVRSRSPRYIERTAEYVIKQIPIEADIIIKNALKGMDK